MERIDEDFILTDCSKNTVVKDKLTAKEKLMLKKSVKSVQGLVSAVDKLL